MNYNNNSILAIAVPEQIGLLYIKFYFMISVLTPVQECVFPASRAFASEAISWGLCLEKLFEKRFKTMIVLVQFRFNVG